MAKRKVCVSFDYEDDKDFRNLLSAWDKNSNFEFTFNDLTPKEIQTSSVSVVKQVLTRKINAATYTLVIIGKNANKRHRDSTQIGYKNWINFEVARSKANGNKLVAIKLDNSYESPDEILGSGASWARSFTQASIMKAIRDA